MLLLTSASRCEPSFPFNTSNLPSPPHPSIIRTSPESKKEREERNREKRAWAERETKGERERERRTIVEVATVATPEGEDNRMSSRSGEVETDPRPNHTTQLTHKLGPLAWSKVGISLALKITSLN